jgi:hypothetical protein
MMRVGVEDRIDEQDEIYDETDEHCIRNVGKIAVVKGSVLPETYELYGGDDWGKTLALDTLKRGAAKLLVLLGVVRFKATEKQSGENKNDDDGTDREHKHC